MKRKKEQKFTWKLYEINMIVFSWMTWKIRRFCCFASSMCYRIAVSPSLNDTNFFFLSRIPNLKIQTKHGKKSALLRALIANCDWKCETLNVNRFLIGQFPNELSLSTWTYLLLWRTSSARTKITTKQNYAQATNERKEEIEWKKSNRFFFFILNQSFLFFSVQHFDMFSSGMIFFMLFAINKNNNSVRAQ